MWMPGSICKVTVWWHSSSGSHCRGKSRRENRRWPFAEVMNLALMMKKYRPELPGNSGEYLKKEKGDVKYVCHLTRPKLNIDQWASAESTDTNSWDSFSMIKRITACWMFITASFYFFTYVGFEEERWELLFRGDDILEFCFEIHSQELCLFL